MMDDIHGSYHSHTSFPDSISKWLDGLNSKLLCGCNLSSCGLLQGEMKLAEVRYLYGV